MIWRFLSAVSSCESKTQAFLGGVNGRQWKRRKGSYFPCLQIYVIALSCVLRLDLLFLSGTVTVVVSVLLTFRSPALIACQLLPTSIVGALPPKHTFCAPVEKYGWIGAFILSVCHKQ